MDMVDILVTWPGSFEQLLFLHPIDTAHVVWLWLAQQFWFDFCFTALQHILGHFEPGQLP